MEVQKIHIPVISSTNAFAQQMIREGNIHGDTIIYTDFQDAGRGTGTNRWMSEEGQNLLMSWVIFPAFLSGSEQFSLSKAVSLALFDFLDEHQLVAKIKWPNDIICQDRKICGILIENSIQGSVLKSCVVGIGLNINQVSFPEFDIPATSMRQEKGRSFHIEQLLDQLTDCLYRWYDVLKEGSRDRIDSAYHERMYRLGIVTTFRDRDGSFRGVIRGVTREGELIMERAGKKHHYGFHDIRMMI